MARDFTVNAASRVITTLTSHSTERTFSVWCYRTGGGGSNTGRIFDKGAGVDQLIHYNNRVLYTRYASGGTSNDWFVGNFPTNQWVHICLAYNTAAQTSVQAWVNGVVNISANETTTNPLLTNELAYIIGNRTDTARAFGGSIQDFAVWDTLLNADEAMALYRGAPPDRIRPEALVSYVPLWGDSSPEPDLVGSTATVYNTAKTGFGAPRQLYSFVRPQFFEVPAVFGGATHEAEASLSANSVLASTARRTQPAVTTLEAQSLLADASSFVTTERSTALQAEGLLLAESSLRKPAQSNLQATSSIVAETKSTTPAATTLAATSSLDALPPLLEKFASSSLSAESDAVAAAVCVVPGSVSLVAGSSLVSQALSTMRASAGLQATSDVVAEALQTTSAQGAAQLLGVGTLESAASSAVVSRATLAGTGWLNADGVVTGALSGAASASAEGSIVASATVQKSANASLVAKATAVAEGLVFGMAEAGASLVAAGVLAAEMVVTKFAGAAFVAQGVMAAAGELPVNESVDTRRVLLRGVWARRKTLTARFISHRSLT